MKLHEISEMLLCILLVIYAAVSAAEDIKHREISLKLSLLFAVLGIILSITAKRELTSLLTALLPGLMIFITALLTDGAVGIGDAVFAGTCAAYLELRELGICIAVAWALCALTALILIAGTMIAAHSGSGIKRGLPFAAYMLPPILITVWLRVV